MSAFVVTPNHINAIIRFAALKFQTVYFEGASQDLRDPDVATRLGQVLVDANVASVNYRYREHDEPFQFKYRQDGAPISPVQMIKALDCLAYQSCELPDWEDTPACALIEALGHMTHTFLPGYEDAKWSLS